MGTISDYNTDFILDERGRELYWECHRRTDLVRYGLFTGNQYLWPWKGNVQEGIGTDSKYNLFPIPSSDLGANPNLTQNTDIKNLKQAIMKKLNIIFILIIGLGLLVSCEKEETDPVLDISQTTAR